MTRKIMIDYLINQTKFKKEFFEKYTDEEICNSYNIILKENELLEKGITTCRISYNDKDTEKKIDEYISKNNIPIFRDGQIKTSLYHGNYCIVGFPLDEAKKIKEKFNIQIDLIRKILSRADLKTLKVGDKITLTSDNTIFGNIATEKGTVYNIENDKIIIRAFRSRKKCWILKIGVNAEIKKGWKN